MSLLTEGLLSVIEHVVMLLHLFVEVWNWGLDFSYQIKETGNRAEQRIS